MRWSSSCRHPTKPGPYESRSNIQHGAAGSARPGARRSSAANGTDARCPRGHAAGEYGVVKRHGDRVDAVPTVQAIRKGYSGAPINTTGVLTPQPFGASLGQALGNL